MGLFTKKKEMPKADDSKPSFGYEMPKMAEFPSLSDEHEFPSYEPTISDIKKGVGGEEEVEIPIREKPFIGKKMLGAEFTASERPMQKQMAEDKPLFVKIDKYKDVLNTVDAIKSKLEDAEELIRAFEEVRTQEGDKLESWKKDLQNVKEKLLSIDRDLFEV